MNAHDLLIENGGSDGIDVRHVVLDRNDIEAPAARGLLHGSFDLLMLGLIHHHVDGAAIVGHQMAGHFPVAHVGTDQNAARVVFHHVYDMVMPV